MAPKPASDFGAGLAQLLEFEDAFPIGKGTMV